MRHYLGCHHIVTIVITVIIATTIISNIITTLTIMTTIPIVSSPSFLPIRCTCLDRRCARPLRGSVKGIRTPPSAWRSRPRLPKSNVDIDKQKAKMMMKTEPINC